MPDFIEDRHTWSCLYDFNQITDYLNELSDGHVEAKEYIDLEIKKIDKKGLDLLAPTENKKTEDMYKENKKIIDEYMYYKKVLENISKMLK